MEEENIKTITEYLYEKKLSRIHEHSAEIIFSHFSEYIKKVGEERKKNFFLQEYKAHCSDLIKARLRGIITRKKFRKKMGVLKKCKRKILQILLGHKVRMILRGDYLQGILIDIANVKTLLKNKRGLNMDKQDIWELKTRLNQSKNE